MLGVKQLYLVANADSMLYHMIIRRSIYGKKDKLIKKLTSNPKDFTFDDAETLLGYFSFKRSDKGHTSGSRVRFTSEEHETKILLHKPHPRKELLEYQVKQLIEQLKQEGLL